VSLPSVTPVNLQITPTRDGRRTVYGWNSGVPGAGAFFTPVALVQRGARVIYAAILVETPAVSGGAALLPSRTRILRRIPKRPPIGSKEPWLAWQRRGGSVSRPSAGRRCSRPSSWFGKFVSFQWGLRLPSARDPTQPPSG